MPPTAVVLPAPPSSRDDDDYLHIRIIREILCTASTGEGQTGTADTTKPVLHGTDDYHWLGGGTSAKITSGSAEKPGKSSAEGSFFLISRPV